MRLNVELEDDLHKSLKQKAAESGKTLSEFMRDMAQKAVGLKKRTTLAINPRLEPAVPGIEDKLNEMRALSTGLKDGKVKW